MKDKPDHRGAVLATGSKLPSTISTSEVGLQLNCDRFMHKLVSIHTLTVKQSHNSLAILTRAFILKGTVSQIQILAQNSVLLTKNISLGHQNPLNFCFNIF